MDAFILAAGRGERLRPLTDHTPKPLVEIGGKPLVEWHLERLREAGFSRVVINVCWLGEQIMRTLGDGRRFGLEIVYSVEPEGALETAGGIVHALPLLREPVFTLVSADIWTDFDFADLEPEPERDAGLVMVSNPRHHPQGDFILDAGRLDLRRAALPGLTYSGIGWYRRSLFERLAPGFRPLRPVLDEAVGKGRVSGSHFTGRWLDIGSAERLKQADEMARNTSSTPGNDP